jgi:hypothetical protein
MEHAHVDRALVSARGVRPAHDVGEHDEDKQKDEREERDEAQQGAHSVEGRALEPDGRGKYIYTGDIAQATPARAGRTVSPAC